MSNVDPSSTLFLRYPDLAARGIPYSREHISRLMKAGKFPRSAKMGGLNVWPEAEIVAWQKGLIAARDREVAA